METIDHKIYRLIRYYERILGTRDPIAIAKFAGIGIATMPLGNVAGYYTLVQRKRWICINEDISTDSPLSGCAAARIRACIYIHRKENCAFLKKYTLLLTSGIERRGKSICCGTLDFR